LFPSQKQVIKNNTMLRILLILLISFLGLSLRSMAQGDLLITPKRIVFEGNKQKETLNIVNLGKDTATYSVSFIQYNMKEDGSFVIIEKPDSGQMFAGSGRTTGNHVAIQA
jgi:P pilus assembly chaperone PapD